MTRTIRHDGHDDDFVTRWTTWHDEYEGQRKNPYGFLAITGLHWLSDTPERFDDAPGLWWSDQRGVHVNVTDGEVLVVDGESVRGEFNFGRVDPRGRRASFDDVEVEIASRDGLDIIRPRSPSNATLAHYTGTPTFAPSPRWALTGHFARLDTPRAIEVGATVEGLAHVYESPGVVEFELEGQSQTLTAFNGETPYELFFIFTDATSGSSTYAACRFLSVNAPDDEVNVTLDFNRATNPPCAYTDFATCPLPPAGNHLSVAIEAGEMLPTVHG